jgi:hypothetical protein
MLRIVYCHEGVGMEDADFMGADADADNRAAVQAMLALDDIFSLNKWGSDLYLQ